MKYSKGLGIAAAIILMASCFLPWAYYTDLQTTFNGYYSEQNAYGKPGILITSLSLLCIVLFLVPKVWAKYWNIFFGAILFTYALKSFVMFAGCYPKGCPVKLAGIWIMIFSAAAVLGASLFPSMPVKKQS